jgi:hypothetical protein
MTDTRFYDKPVCPRGKLPLHVSIRGLKGFRISPEGKVFYTSMNTTIGYRRSNIDKIDNTGHQ